MTPPPSRAARAGKLLPVRLSPAGAIGCFIAFICLLLFALCGRQIWIDHEQQLAESTQSSADLTRSLAQHAESSIQSVDTVLAALVWELNGNAHTPRFLDHLHEHLTLQVMGLPQLLGLFVIDEHGRIEVDSLSKARVRPNVLERDYFHFHRSHAERATHVGAAIQSKAFGKWVMPISRRLSHRDGSFAGVVVAAMDLDYFQHFYDSYALGEHGAIMLLHREGTLLVRRPAQPVAPGTSLLQMQLFKTQLPHARAATYTAISKIDQLEKLSSYRELERYPLVVAVSLPLDDILADWRSGAIAAASVVTALALVVSMLGYLLARTLQRTLQAESALLESERRVRTIGDNLPLAISYAGPDETLQFANHAFAQSVRRTLDQTIGQSFAVLFGDDYAERAPFIKSALAGKAVQFERRARGEGSPRYFESRYIPEIDQHGQVRGFYTVTVDISARKQLELEQKDAHRELQTIIDNMSSVVGYWDANLRFRFANKAFLMRYRVTRGDMRGMHARDVIGAEALAANLPYIEATLDGRSQLFERQMTTPDGELRSEVVSYVPDVRYGKVAGFYAYVTDITPLKAARSAQFEARAQLQAVIDAATGLSIIASDLNGIIRIFSAGAERMLGYRAEEMIGRRTPAILHLPDELAQHGLLRSSAAGTEWMNFDALLAAIGDRNALDGEWTYVRKNGSWLTVHLVITLVRSERGELSGVLALARDITEQKQLLASLNAAKEQAERASRAKSEFVANMSHEIRTPMNAVLGMSQLLGNYTLSPVQRNYLDMIQTAGKSLLDILNDILDFSKIEAGRMDLSPTPFRLSDVFATLAALLMASGEKKKLEIVIAADPDVPDRLLGDAQRLQQVLLNIAGNAIKFTEHGEVVISVARAAGPRRDDGALDLCFRIADTGIGISAAQQARLFSAFSQAEESTARRFGGTGLGLAISRRLVELMGGAISVTSEPGQGSEFVLDIPFMAASDGAHSGPRPACPARRVLVLEQNRSSAGHLARLIQSWHWPVAVASEPPLGLALLQQSVVSAQPYDVVLAAWPPPADADEAVLAAQRAICVEQQIPFILMVNPYFRQNLSDSAIAVQSSAIMLKPVTASGLSSTFDDLARAAAPAPAPLHGAHRPPGAPDERIDGVRLLLVEDNRFNQLVAKGMLEHAGASVVAVDDGKQALDHLARHGDRYDMVLMDVQMPVLDGFMAMRAIRTGLGLMLPVLAMSAGVMLDERDACVAAGMNDFIAKPIEQTHLIAVIRRHLPARRVASERAATPPAPAPTGQGDFDRLYNYLPHDPAYRRGIIEFVDSVIGRGPDALQQARATCESGHFADAARMLHAMRGSIGSAGGRQFAETSLLLEQAMQSPQPAQLAQLFAQAEQQLTTLAAAARSWLAQRAAEAPIAADAPADPFDAGALAQLRALLEQHNMAACAMFARLRPALRTHVGETELAALDEAVGALAFERARELLAHIVL